VDQSIHLEVGNRIWEVYDSRVTELAVGRRRSAQDMFCLLVTSPQVEILTTP
jgi:hypothetical protein